jgi:hypothetical protein
MASMVKRKRKKVINAMLHLLVFAGFDGSVDGMRGMLALRNPDTFGNSENMQSKP